MKSLDEMQIQAKIQAGQYNDIETDFIIRLDELDNVITVFEEELAPAQDGTYKYPTRCAYVRNATNAKPLAERLAPDHKDVLAINAFLRALNVVKGIAYLVDQKHLQQPDNEHYKIEQQKLKNILQTYYEKVFNTDPVTDPHKHFKNLEADFHTEILTRLNSLNLTRGLKEPDDYINLLERYRNLASLLTPARSYVTTVKHTTALGDFTYVDAAHPITKKTATQKAQIALMLAVKSATEKDTPQNFQSVSPLAMQEAAAVFAPLLMRDDTALGAQTRNTIAPTAKNAFVVINKIIFPDNTTAEMSILRTASLAYIGQGETPASCVNYATENIKQLQAAAHDIAHKDKLYINILMTNHFWNSQSTMIAISREGALQTGTNVSVLPTNLFGLSYAMEITPEVETLARDLGLALPPITTDYKDLLNKKSRTVHAASVINIINSGPDSIAVVGCASGQDRTGSALEIAIIRWTAAELLKRGFAISEEEVTAGRALGCHNAMLATLTVPGSAGMKVDSIPHYFSQLITQFYYRATADTNKHPKIDSVTVKNILTLVEVILNEDLEKNFTENSQKINQVTNTGSVMHALAHWANAATHYQNNKYSAGLGGFVSSFFRYGNKSVGQEEGLLGRKLLTEITKKLAISHQYNPNTSADLLKEMDEQLQRVMAIYPSQKSSTVAIELAAIMTLATKKLNELQPAQEKSTVSEFKQR